MMLVFFIAFSTVSLFPTPRMSSTYTGASTSISGDITVFMGWQSLDSRRQDQPLVHFTKLLTTRSSETEDILMPADSRTRKNHSFKFKDLQANCDSYRYSFFPATISSWINLPFGIEKVDSVTRSSTLQIEAEGTHY